MQSIPREFDQETESSITHSNVHWQPGGGVEGRKAPANTWQPGKGGSAGSRKALIAGQA